jgi:hypothetical protein
VAEFGFHAQNYLRKVISTASGATAIIQLAFKYDTGNTIPLFSVQDGSSTQFSLWLNSGGTLSVNRGLTTATLGTTSVALSTGVYYYVDLKVLIGPSAGTVDLYLNNTAALNLTSQNTRATSNSQWSAFVLGCEDIGGVGFGNYDFDDLVIMDGVDATSTQGAAFNARLGDVSVITTMPTGDGNYTQFTPHSSSSHYQNVDENPPTDDTDYNDGVNVNDRDSYTYAIPSTQTILALAAFPYMKQSNAATRSFKEFIRAGGTDYDNSTTVNLSTAYTFYPQIRGVDPSTSLPFAGGSTEIGIKVVS